VTIKHFIAKPVEVTGIVWTGGNYEEIRAFCNGLAHWEATTTGRRLVIETREGTSPASIGDTIVCGVKGEFYPVKPDVMAAKYDEVQSEADR
jgi:hypothetical protein